MKVCWVGWLRSWNQDWYHFNCNKWRGTEEPLDEAHLHQEESEKAGLKFNIQKTKIMASGPITSWQIDEEKVERVSDIIFLGFKINMDGDCSHKIKRRLLLGRKAIKKQRHHFADKDLCSQSYDFSSSHVWMWELGQKEDWAPKNWCFQTVVLEKTLESPLDSREIK